VRLVSTVRFLKEKGWVDGERGPNEAGLVLKIALMSSQEW